jgi:branched-subunit amino acid ABC-type transport system permease component
MGFLTGIKAFVAATLGGLGKSRRELARKFFFRFARDKN